MPADPPTNGGAEDPLVRMGKLTPRGKAPSSTSTLDRWVSQAQRAVGLEAGRLSWLIASAVVVAALQRAVDEDGQSRFLLKGGTYLQYRLRWAGRPTRDVDGLIRGDIEEFLVALDGTLAQPWEPLQLTRTPIEVIDVPGKLVKPRRFDVQVLLRGDVWRRIKVEVSPDEGDAAAEHDLLPAPDLEHFGIQSPVHLFGIAMRFQIAQKIHACTDPHSPPEQTNDRARDVVDLLLLRDLVAAEGGLTLPKLREACVAVFAARAEEAERVDWAPRTWPPTALAHAHWSNDYANAAGQAGLTLALPEAIVELNTWIGRIDASSEGAKRD